MKILIVALFVVAMTALTTAAEDVAGMVPSCPPGWMMSRIQCVYYVPENKTWAEAKDHCLSMGAKLVPIFEVNILNSVDDIDKVLHSAGHENGQVWIQDCNEQGTDGGTVPSCFQISKGKRVPGCLSDKQCEAHLPSVCSKVFY